jgi:uncharacterized protein (DUF111 family)
LPGGGGRAHGVASVVLHELGSLDTLIDVVGAVAGLRLLGVEGLFSSSLPLGRGEVEAAHGTLPVPAPATLVLLADANAPISEVDLAGELVTPTGAALVATLARFQRPAMTLDKVAAARSRNRQAAECPPPGSARSWRRVTPCCSSRRTSTTWAASC